MNREITITRTESVNYKDDNGEVKPTGQRVQNTYTQEWDTFCKVWGNVDNWKELDKDGKLTRTMFLGGACHKKRKDENTVYRSMFILDIDNDSSKDLVTMDMVDAFLKGYDYFVYSTYSHTTEYPRFRVMLPLVDDVEAEAWKERQSDMKAYFEPIVDDTSCFTLSQGQIMPCYRVGGRDEVFCKRVHGVFFDLDVIPRVIKRNLVIDPYKTYTTHNYTEDTVLDFARMVAKNAMGQFNRNHTFRFACWLVANGIYDLDLIRQVSSFDAGTSPEQHMKDAAAKFHQYNGNNYHMGWYKQYQDKDFWILHAPKKEETFQFDKTFNRFEHAKKEASKNDWEYYELGVNDKFGSVHEKINYKDGDIFLKSDCGTGKSWTMKNDPNVIVLSPYTLLAEQTTKKDPLTGGDYPHNNIFYGSATYDQALSLLNDHLKGGVKNKAALNYDYSKMTLVIDECHVLYNSSNFRKSAIAAVMAIRKLFKRTIFMSGTAQPEYFSDVKFNQCIRVCKHYPFMKRISIFDNNNPQGLLESKLKERARPGIILVNNKDDIEELVKKYPYKFLVITSDTKQDAIIKTLIQNSKVSGYDYIIGTISVVEGLNFTDELKEVDVYILHTDQTLFTTEQIEQVTNRWRNAGLINTYVFRKSMNESEISDCIDFSEGSLTGDDFVRLATENATIANRKLSKAMDKASFRNTYNNTCFSEMIRFDTAFNQYVVDYQLINYHMYNIRRSNEQLDYQIYMFELECYGFSFVDTTYAYSLDISEDKKAQAAAKKSRAAIAGIMLETKYDPSTGKFDSNAVYTNEENKVKSVVQKILAMGDRNVINTIVMPQLTQTDKPLQFANDILFDLRNREQGNMITEEIRRVYMQLENGRGFITNDEKNVLAESVLKTIKLQRYEGDEHYNYSSYGNYVDENGHLKGKKTANVFLKRFTCFDEYKYNGLRGMKNVRFSRTGLI
ncbi:DEAD/DEAH box helicase family protein [Citrobacter sp. Cb010]|uniref:DEAD/DEAH box helicase family protein n=1 Tax=unclassified Citrobacter TaxID=2644389 RepID=UPI0025781E7E|nr:MULTISPECIES: DEAD/DEAH box helicase family protein [unclassified Citrobacter]MDM3373324.1 DEAD/DEAH box helicase family protein [Citrobacter sp. Cb010]MDM3460495.1 DEAD/DEAH box helicase family protein [Citrobacter sp. Cb036]